MHNKFHTLTNKCSTRSHLINTRLGVQVEEFDCCGIFQVFYAFDIKPEKASACLIRCVWVSRTMRQAIAKEKPSKVSTRKRSRGGPARDVMVTDLTENRKSNEPGRRGKS